MIISPAGATFIEGYEALRLSSYLPTKHDVWTIGYGSTGPDIGPGMTWTKAQANARFQADLKRFGLSLANLIGQATTTQAQFDAMGSLAYNIGMGAFGKSTVLRRHLAKDYMGAAVAFMLWDKQDGNALPGLTKRRAAEAAMYRGDA